LFVEKRPTNGNPFVQLYQPSLQLRELALTVSAAVPGPRPSAVLNDIPYTVGDDFQGMKIYRIDTDVVYLRRDFFLLACPVSNRPLTIRLP